ncbi:MAG: hypothetical protein E6J97_04965 [Methanobacteriota archaeon]|nr:MAG: hypothetical protein E6J97_04965 [Euryarchaeota archaeon]
MARRKRKDDTPAWVAPDFDEVGFMRREIEGARAAVATIAWAVVGALVGFALYSVLPVLAFFGGRDWIGHGIMYFFSWLAFWIILLNPPFSDHTPPTIQGITVSPYHSGYTGDLLCMPPAGSVSMGPGNDSLYILFRATDNVGLRNVEVHAAPQGSTPFVVAPTLVAGQDNRCVGHHPGEKYAGGTYNATLPYHTGYDITIVASDGSNPPSGVAFSILLTP